MGTLGDVALGITGSIFVVAVLDSAIRTFVLPRGAPTPLTRAVFVSMRAVFNGMTKLGGHTYEARDRIMALYAPLTLLVLPMVWLAMVMGGYLLLFHAVSLSGWRESFDTSGSSLLTLGFSMPSDLPGTLLAFSEAAIGLLLLTLLIAYLPTIYGAFSRREVLMAKLAIRAGDPPWGVGILARAEEMERFHLLDEMWSDWQTWFAELEETHTSLAVLSFFRSPRADRSWVTSAGAVLDAASLYVSAVRWSAHAGTCIRSGFTALRAVAGYFGIPFDSDPAPTDPISITREEFDEALEVLGRAGVPLREDHDQAWRDFAGWRVNYDRPMLGLAGLVMPPYAPWSSDRSLRYRRPPLRRRASNR